MPFREHSLFTVRNRTGRMDALCRGLNVKGGGVHGAPQICVRVEFALGPAVSGLGPQRDKGLTAFSA
jgi:hypothetical protein